MQQTNDMRDSWKSLAQIKSEVLKKIANADDSKAKKQMKFVEVNSKDLKASELFILPEKLGQKPRT